MKKVLTLLIVFAFLLNPLMVSLSSAVEEAVAVMTMPDGAVVSMTPSQLSALASQPGITISPTTPSLGATEIAIPIPAALGGGYIVGTPAAIASALGATGIAPGLKASDVVGATAAAGIIPAGALAGTLATLGTGGTIAAGAAVVGAGTGLLLLSTGGGGGDGRGIVHVPVQH
ncbi:MAG: hypothetical protein ABIB41_00665 [Nitrospirota bacterium]